jgi:hypothetical protein
MKHIIVGALLFVVFLTVIGCADKDSTDKPKTAEGTTDGTTGDAATDYDPAVVDQLSEDFEELDW